MNTLSHAGQGIVSGTLPALCAFAIIFCVGGEKHEEIGLQSQFQLTNDLITRTLAVAEQCMKQSRTILQREFRTRMHNYEKVDLETMRHALKVKYDPMTQAEVLGASPVIKKLLAEAGLTPLEFTQSVSTIELALLSLKGKIDKEWEKKLQECANCAKAVSGKPPEEVQSTEWQWVPVVECEANQSRQATLLRKPVLDLVRNRQAEAEKVLTGYLLLDWNL